VKSKEQKNRSTDEVKRHLDLESEKSCREQIRRRLALPMHKRMNFLRVRLPGGGSCL
jgi:hypothetical protein